MTEFSRAEPHRAHAAEPLRKEFDAIVDDLYARQPEQRIERRLDATRLACELLGDVHHAFRMVHVTGTNGKSSTARTAAALLQATGLRVGLFTSPHLVDLNERIEIDGTPVGFDTVVRIWHEISPILDLANTQLASDGKPALTFFETLTALAYAIFADAPVDVAVVEVGMGGEWDSTNVADADVAVFAPVALDHMQQLGDTIEKIATTKAGIMKPGSIAVSAHQEPEALSALQHRADELGIPLYVEGVEFAVTHAVPAVGGSVFSLSGLAGTTYTDIALPLLGEYQVHNAALAIAAVEAFLGGGEEPLGNETLEIGMEHVKSPGRLQVIAHEPTVLIDAAHNPHGAQSLATALQTLFHFERTVGVIGILADKDARGMLQAWRESFDEVVVTASASPRAMPVQELRNLVEDYYDPQVVHVADTVEAAVSVARELVEPDRGEGIVVCGSITVIGEAVEAVNTRG